MHGSIYFGVKTVVTGAASLQPVASRLVDVKDDEKGGNQ